MPRPVPFQVSGLFGISFLTSLGEEFGLFEIYGLQRRTPERAEKTIKFLTQWARIWKRAQLELTTLTRKLGQKFRRANSTNKVPYGLSAPGALKTDP